ncbi:CAP domain-containing protein [Sanguibacter sp. 25GB23B1]|uniref:CAP domain-containing protein n=1 Tax=unclassified Sanguibacter TaxID=2645534 RepID=UPI0032B0070B
MKSKIVAAVSVLVLTLMTALSGSAVVDRPAPETVLTTAPQPSVVKEPRDPRASEPGPVATTVPLLAQAPAVEVPPAPVEPAPAPAPVPEPEVTPAPRPTVAPEPAPAPAPAAVPEPAPAVAASGAPNSSGAQALFAALNGARAAAGLPPLAYDDSLASVAQSWSASMSTSEMAHNPSVSAQIPPGWSTWGENVAFAGGYPDLAGTIHSNWMNSPGHRQNILRAGFTHVGIGYHVDAAGTAWATQVFATY